MPLFKKQEKIAHKILPHNHNTQAAEQQEWSYIHTMEGEWIHMIILKNSCTT